MTKREFLAALKVALSGLPKDEIEQQKCAALFFFNTFSQKSTLTYR